ncbi:MAG: DEAD/DEAH box helicase, partial [Pseudomonadota bacterium]
DLGLADPLLRALADRGHAKPTPIQAKAIPAVLEGRDLLGIAQTGTGKTGAFVLPVLDALSRGQRLPAAAGPRALILAPTRELAIQIGEEVAAYGVHLRLKHTVIFGGVGYGPQKNALQRGLDVLIATPGRLIDHLEQGTARLGAVEHLVLDEADRMLDMGFIRDVRKVLERLPQERRTLLFSATMAKEVSRLAADILDNPARVEIAPQATPIERIEQRVHHVAAGEKLGLLEEVLRAEGVKRTIVFTRTKHRANRVAEQLAKRGITADALHGNKSQGARQRALAGFREGGIRVLVATDIAARGIDVDAVTHVVNFELPNEPESYVHRIGRTARAGNDGVAISLCAPDELAYLRDIERLTRTQMTVVGAAPSEAAPGAKLNGKPGAKPGAKPNGKPAQKQGKGRSRWAGKPEQKPAAKAGPKFAAQPDAKAEPKPAGEAPKRRRSRRRRPGPQRTAA